MSESRWTILKVVPSAKPGVWVLARCRCGTEREIKRASVLSGRCLSCGCLQREVTARLMTTHGMTGSPEYYSWSGMLTRCTNPKANNYHDYGGRGITVCDRWLGSFANFYRDMGTRPEGHTLDRIDPDGNYEPSNCRWATLSEQNSNQRHPMLCRNGHPRTPENTITRRSDAPGVRCRDCANESARRNYARRMAASKGLTVAEVTP